MTRHPLVIRGRRFHADGFVPLDLGVDPQTGSITAVGRSLQGDRVVDHGDGLLLPGAIDVHVHMRDPGHPAKEDFESGTRAALAGGVTTVFDMPNTSPATTSVARYREKRDLVAPKALTDWGLWGGSVGNVEDTLALSRVAPGLKVYLGESTGQVMLGDPDRLSRLLQALVAAGDPGVLAFHAEAQTVLEEAAAGHEGEPGLAGHEARRPVSAELTALSWIHEAVTAARRSAQMPLRVHIAHVSSGELLQAVLAQGYGCGVTPHHLLLHSGSPLEGYGRVNPPLRQHDQADGLFAEFAAGRIPVLESDHAPHTRAEKSRPVDRAPSGMPGVETLVPVMLARALDPASTGGPRLDPERVVQATTAAPARLFGLNKGRLEPGCDADLAVYHLEDVAPLEPGERYTRCGWSPFAGWPALFPRTVYLRAREAVVDHRVVAAPGDGQEVVTTADGRARSENDPPA